MAPLTAYTRRALAAGGALALLASVVAHVHGRGADAADRRARRRGAAGQPRGRWTCRSMLRPTTSTASSGRHSTRWCASLRDSREDLDRQVRGKRAAAAEPAAGVGRRSSQGRHVRDAAVVRRRDRRAHQSRRPRRARARVGRGPRDGAAERCRRRARRGRRAAGRREGPDDRRLLSRGVGPVARAARPYRAHGRVRARGRSHRPSIQRGAADQPRRGDPHQRRPGDRRADRAAQIHLRPLGRHGPADAAHRVRRTDLDRRHQAGLRPRARAGAVRTADADGRSGDWRGRAVRRVLDEGVA